MAETVQLFRPMNICQVDDVGAPISENGIATGMLIFARPPEDAPIRDLATQSQVRGDFETAFRIGAEIVSAFRFPHKSESRNAGGVLGK